MNFVAKSDILVCFNTNVVNFVKQYFDSNCQSNFHEHTYHHKVYPWELLFLTDVILIANYDNPKNS